MDDELERRVIYARRENLPAPSRPPILPGEEAETRPQSPRRREKA